MSERSQPARDEFFVGYLPQAPPVLARWLRGRVLALLLLVAATAAVLVVSQRPFDRSVFEFGVTRSFEGRIELAPYPTLVVERPGLRAGDVPAVSRYLLVSFGKRGAPAAVRELAGRRVRLEGSLVYRDDRTMIELAGSALQVLSAGTEDAGAGGGGGPGPADEDLGERTLRGEIVDSKCFLGVMKPGNLKPHRACATRCISGGVPPVLLVRDEEGRARYLLLASADGRAVNEDVLGMIAEPIEITGRVLRLGDLHVLRADPAGYRRIPD